MYASRLSMVSSNSDYPSDLSSVPSISFKHSMLGLTESPLSRSSPAVQSAPSTPASLAQPSRGRDRGKRSQSTLHQSQSVASLAEAARSLGPVPANHPEVRRHAAVISGSTTGADSHVASRSSSQAERKIHRKPVPLSEPRPNIKQAAKAKSGIWEEELVRSAERLRLDDRAPSQHLAGLERLREHQRKTDAEWERNGLWDKEQSAAREAEDRTRREAGREIGKWIIAMLLHC